MLLKRLWERLKSWEGLLLVILIASVILNIVQSPVYLGVGNLVNLFQLSIEKIIIALMMTFIIVNGEIDLSIASVMGMSACILASLFSQGVSVEVAMVIALLAGAVAGAFNGFWIAYVGLPSLAVTLAGLIGYRGIARILLEDRSIGNFPEWFDALGQKPLIGPFPLAVVIFFVFIVVAIVILQYSAFGRYVYVIGNNREAARYSGVKVRQVKMILFIASGMVAALAGLLFAGRLGAVRGNMAEGFELDIITMVLLGGVSIFGGTGTLMGVGLSILIILNLRNGMSLVNVTGNTQTSVIGVLLILSVLLPNLARDVQSVLKRRSFARPKDTKQEETTQTI
jgi:rhamnose transport system permease protein